MSFWTDSISCKVPQLRSCYIARMLPSTAYLDSVISIFPPCFVRNHLDSVHLQDGARCPPAGLRVINSSHAFFNCQSASTEREGECFALEGGGGGGCKDGKAGTLVEAVWSRGINRFYATSGHMAKTKAGQKKGRRKLCPA